MDIIAKLGTLLGLSFVSGINLYATVAVTGLVTKFHLIQGLPPEFQALNNDLIITVAILLYVCEFLADKIPGFDTAWDAIHTVVRPFGGALLALMTVGKATPAVEVLAFMLGAAMATGSHLAKSGFRVLINTSPEPFSNIFVSITEDAGVIGLTYLSMAHPVYALVITVVFSIIIILVLPLLWRAVRMILSGLWYRLKNLGRTIQKEDMKVFFMKASSRLAGINPSLENAFILPAWVTKVRGLKRWQKGYLALDNSKAYFLPARIFRKNLLSIELPEKSATLTASGFLFWKLQIKGKTETWNLIVPRDYSKILKENIA